MTWRELYRRARHRLVRWRTAWIMRDTTAVHARLRQIEARLWTDADRERIAELLRDREEGPR